jgi:hypothetical protein
MSIKKCLEEDYINNEAEDLFEEDDSLYFHFPWGRMATNTRVKGRNYGGDNYGRSVVF